MRRDLCHTPKINRRFASERRSGPRCCDPDENCTGHSPILIPLVLDISSQGIWHVLFLAKVRVISLCSSYIASTFLNIEIITPLCQSLGVLHTSTQLHTLALTREFLLQSALPTSRIWLYLHQQLFQIYPFNCRCHFCCSENFLFPKCVTSCESRVDAFTGFKRSSKNSLHRVRISFSSIRMLPSESLMEYVTLDLLPHKWHMVYLNTLSAEK